MLDNILPSGINDQHLAGIDNPRKHKIRKKVLEYLTRGPTNIRYVGFPGRHWIFEKMLLEENPESNLCCFEVDEKIFEYSIWRTPLKTFKLGSENGLTLLSGKNIDFINCDLGTQVENPTVQAVKDIKWNCAWLDFCVTVNNKDLEKSLKFLYNVADDEASELRLAITFLNGRDAKNSGLLGRVNKLISILHTCTGYYTQIVGFTKYTSLHNKSLGIAFLKLKKK